MTYIFNAFDSMVLLDQNDTRVGFQPDGQLDNNRLGDGRTGFAPLFIPDLGAAIGSALLAPPSANDDTINASGLVTVFDLFADNGNGVDSDADGDTLTITQINGMTVIVGTVITLNNGLVVTYLGGGMVEFNTVGLDGGDVVTDTFTYTIDDGNGGTDTASVNVSFTVNALNLSSLSATDGYRITLGDDGVSVGFSVSNLGDVNGDGIDDYIIGGPNGPIGGGAGVIFGSAAGFPGGLDLNTLDGTNGFEIRGPGTLDLLGASVSSAGDVNGDGINDILIGSPGTGGGEGVAFVIFGSNTPFSAVIDATTLNGTNGFIISSGGFDTDLGTAVSNIGDINNDGFDDIIIGSRGVSEGGDPAGAYVIFGSNTPFPAVFDLATLNGTNGFVIPTFSESNGLGQAVTGLGDINGDGIADFAIGSPTANGAFGLDSFTGEVYVVFGNAAGFGASLDLLALDGTNGFIINAISAGAELGRSISDIGDVNGDGFADILIGAPGADSSTGVAMAGQAYVIYGAANFTASLDLVDLNGFNGFVIDGINRFDGTGFSVSGVGDFNGDGIDDFVIGAPFAGPNGNQSAGQAYLIFGGNFGNNPVLDLTNLDVTNGFALFGANTSDSSGFSVSGAGDVNNDGFADLLIGAPDANDAGSGAQGVGYIMFGFGTAPANTPPVANDDAFTTDEDNAVGGNVFADNGNGIDSDADGDPLTVTEVAGSATNVGLTIAGSSGGLFTIAADGTFTFDPNGDFEFLAQIQTRSTGISYTIDDGTGLTSTAVASVVVTGVNDAPIASADDFTTNSVTELVGNVIFDDNGLGVDSDPDGPVSVTSVNGVKANVGLAVAGSNGGIFIIIPSGGIIFRPNGDFSGLLPGQTGTTSVTYTIADAFGEASTATVTVTVLDGTTNIDPIARADNVAAGNLDPTSGNVFWDNGSGPDEDADGDVLTVTQVNFTGSFVGTAVAGDNGGIFTINGDGTYTFNPNGEFTGLSQGQSVFTSVSYTIADGNGGSSETQIIIEVFNGPAGSFLARDDDFATGANTTVTGDVFADNGNGPDNRGSASTSVVQVDGQFSNVGAQVFGNNGGLFTINSDGSFTFDPNGDFAGLAPGETTLTSVQYVNSLGDGGSNPALVTVVVTGAAAGAGNTAPVAQNDTFFTDEDNAVGGNVFADNSNGVDSDADGDPFTVSAVNGATSNVGINVVGSTGGIFLIQSNGVFSFQPNGDYDTLAVGESAVSTASYTIDDGNGGTNTATVTVTIDGANDTPFGVTPIPAQNVGDGAPVTDLVLTPFFDDVDANDTLTITVDIATLPPGLLYNLATNTITGTPNADASQGGPNGDGIYTVRVFATDSEEARFVTNVVYTVANPAPVAQPDALSTNESSSINGSVFADNGSGADSDADGDVFTVSNVNGSSANVGTAIAGSAGGLFTINADGSYSFDPNGEFNGLNTGDSQDTTVTYTIDDAEGGSSTATVTVTVNGVTSTNAAPIAQDDALSTDEDSVLNGDVFTDNGNGVDSDPDNNAFTVTAVAGVSANVATAVAGTGGGLFTINANGSFSFNPHGEFEALAAGTSTTSTITYTIDDGNGGSDTATVTVTINGVNDAPVANNDVLAVDENLPAGTLVGAVIATDIDAGDVLGFAITGGNTNNAFAIDPTGQITTTSALDHEVLASYNLTIVVTDTGGLTDTANITVNIGNVNEAPVAADDDISGTPANNSFDLLANNGNGIDSDPDGDNLTVTHINGIAVVVGSTIALANSLVLTVTGNGTFEFNTLQPGLYLETLTYTVSDGNGLSSTATVTARFEVNSFDLANTNTNGVIINGVAANDESGFALAAAGDINNDGFADFLVGAHFAGPDADSDAGVAYVIFGGPNGPVPLGQDFDLADLDGTNGFALTGIDQFDNAAWSVASAGDVNGDGIDDLIISGHLADPNGGQSGEVYIVFGGTNFGAEFDLGSLNGTNGFIINGIDAVDQAGYSVSGAGDVNGDGINDILIGARGADPGGLEHAGETYVVFGSADGFPSVLELADLNGTNGFVINGIDAEDFSGFAVSGVGDVNGDGLADILIGAPGADDGTGAGEAYIVFGSATGFSASMNLAGLNGSNGFTITGLRPGDGLGFSVSGGDFNGDGIDDILIGAQGQGSEQAFVIFGTQAGFGANFDLGTLDGTNGFAITGGSGLAETGFDVTSIGDFDGDGFDDFVVSAPSATANGNAGAGQAYLVYGQAGGFGGLLDINSLNGSNGFTFNGIAAGDNAGFSVSAAGDVNGDGLADILIGAPRATANGVAGAGQSYLIYGFVSGPHNLTNTPPNPPASTVIEGDDQNTQIVEADPAIDGDGDFEIPGLTDGNRLLGSSETELPYSGRETVAEFAIIDFAQGIDVLDIQTGMLSDFAAVLELARDGFDSHGFYVSLDLGADGMFKIYGLTTAMLREDDFTFMMPALTEELTETSHSRLSEPSLDVTEDMLFLSADNGGDNFHYTEDALAPRDVVVENADLSGTVVDLTAFANFLDQDDSYANVYVNSEGVLEIGLDEDIPPQIDLFDFS